MSTTVLYHGPDCHDGFMAAYCAWLVFGTGARYLSVQYGQDPPAVEHGSDLVILDFCYPVDVLRRLADQSRSLLVLDHHATAQRDMEDFGHPRAKTVFDMERSGAGIAWDYFHNPGNRPALVRYVEDRDLWRWALPDSRAVSAWIQSHEMTFPIWGAMAASLERHPGVVVVEGGAILRYQARLVSQQLGAERVRFEHSGTATIPMVNASVLMSEVGEALLDRFPDAPYAGYYFDRADKRHYGFRSRKDGQDVSLIAKAFGGGGHPHAAGFTTPLPG